VVGHHAAEEDEIVGFISAFWPRTFDEMEALIRAAE
jgi:hypothetical protein